MTEGAAVLEAVFMGPELEFTDDAMVAVTGAELPPKLDGVPRETWTSFKVKRGQILSFDFLKKGARAYIAVAGGIDVPVVLGIALDLRARRARRLQGTQARSRRRAAGRCGRDSGQGGPHGRRRIARLADGDAARSCASCPAFTGIASPMPPAGVSFLIPGRSRRKPTGSATASRGGKPLEFVPREPPFGAGSDPSNIADACYPYGSIQVPGGTEPIVLHRDAVSGGGYFMVGTVISADMDLIGQLQPNTPVRFVKVEMDQALAARKVRAELLAKIRSSLKSSP